MNSQIIHQSPIPDSVRALDALINEQIANGRDVDRWLRLKVDVKRRLAAVPTTSLEREARNALDAIARQATLRGAA